MLWPRDVLPARRSVAQRGQLLFVPSNYSAIFHPLNRDTDQLQLKIYYCQNTGSLVLTVLPAPNGLVPPRQPLRNVANDLRL